MTSLLRIILGPLIPTLRHRRCYRRGHTIISNGHGETACTWCWAHWRGVE